jgi:hypothetical protein
MWFLEDSMTTIYKGVSVGRTVAGRVDSSGTIYNSGSGGSAVGQIGSDGIIYKGVSVGRSAVGQVGSDGTIYKGVSVGRSAVGRVDSSGTIYNSSSGGSAVGQVDGEMLAGAAGAALLLFGLDQENNGSGTKGGEPASKQEAGGGSGGSEDKPGCLGLIVRFIAFCVRLFKTWSGRVGMVLGVAAGIAMASQAGDFMNALFIGIFACLLLLFIGGTLGTLVGFIFRKSSKSGKFGGLIGAGALALTAIILGIIYRYNAGNIIMLVSFGVAAGWILGTVIGAIVGAIRKEPAKVN